VSGFKLLSPNHHCGDKVLIYLAETKQQNESSNSPDIVECTVITPNLISIKKTCNV
jgi:hypothetical protein